jgi:hypothetical protein
MMNFEPIDPPRALFEVMKLDLEKMEKKWIFEISNYIFYNECGIAYDILVFLINKGDYEPTTEALRLIKLAGLMLGVEYPNLCHPI